MTSRGFGDDVAPSGQRASGPAGTAPPAEPPAPAPLPLLRRRLPPPVASEPRLALLIGNADYGTTRTAGLGSALGRLETPVADVGMLADLLASLGFAVETVANAELATMQDALAEFATRVDAAGADAVALVYFAGHGFQDAGAIHLLPIGADLPSRAYLRARTVSADDIVQALATTRRKANVILLDVCRTTPAGAEPRSRDITDGMAELKLPPGATMLVAYSTSAGATAADTVLAAGPVARQSPYAAALQQALPGLLHTNRRIYDVFFEAAERVRQDTGGTQSPALYVQGVAPPLNVTKADRKRFRTWVRGHRSWRERALRWVGAVALTVSIVTAGTTWFRSFPETRTVWLAASGLQALPWMRWHHQRPWFYASRIDGFLGSLGDNLCESDGAAADRFGITRKEWCTLPAHDIVERRAKSGHWNIQDEWQRAEEGDIVAMTLVAAARPPTDPELEDWQIEENRRRVLPIAMRAARAGWLPAWVVVHQWTQDPRNEAPVADGEILQGLLEAHRAGIATATVALHGKP